ncbi:hypothetical protein D0B54_22980 [Solimonas sp. K1W22B-7]|uniref:hypothetical protein n=1 Tax=Solimonas sp. K1W22B-7 TaxID=2303331 RepID=UPI000E331C83|nr:hypothetical protein [Solimonas sp. K1W22B-7]AXQ31372.1 hypothetical protein D0B54_22980 [Solimonas sp. K1W22B-7]
MKILELMLLGANLVVLVLGIGIGLVQWVVAARAMISIPGHYRPEINPWSWRTAFNPQAGLLFPQLLTKEGQRHAATFWRAAGLFVLCVAVPFGMAFLTEMATGMQLIRR